MKKFIIMLPIILCVSGASSERIPSKGKVMQLYQEPITVKLDSLNTKAVELKELIKQL